MAKLLHLSSSFFLSALTLFIYSCAPKTTEVPSKLPSNISIHFTDYEPETNKNFIEINLIRPLIPEKEQLRISPEGNITQTFLIEKPREIILTYQYKSLSLVLRPGDQLSLKLSLKEFLDQLQLKHFTVKGSFQKTNELLLQYTHELNQIKQNNNSSSDSKSLSAMDYKAIRLKEMHQQLDTFREIIRKHAIKDTLFDEWGRTQIICSAGIDLALFPFLGRMSPKLDGNHPYFRFQNTISSLSSSTFNWNTSLEYAHYLATDISIISNTATHYHKELESLREDSLSTFPLKWKVAKQMIYSKNQPLVFAYLFHDSSKIPVAYSDSISTYTNPSWVNKKKQKSLKQSVPLIALLKNYPISDQDRNQLLQVFTHTRGKPIFCSFIMEGCPSCQMELPNYHSLSQILNQKTQMVYFGAYMTSMQWKNLIEKYHLKGQKLLLNKNQLAFFEKYFGLYGFPHHHIIDAQGFISHKSVLRVKADNLEAIKKEILK